MRFIFLSIFIYLNGALAQEVPHDWEFVTLKTAHFDVIVNAKQQDLGILYAEKLEEAYAFLAPLFTDKPKRTIVIINDKTDITNGYATPIPYPHIMIYPVLPGPSDSLGETGDWALELLAHEYTHVLTFEPATGFMKPLRYIFGTIASTNLLLPRWWKEGVAVHIETQISKGGRLRSLYQDAMIRSFVKEGRLTEFSIDQANEALPSWPKGHRPYLFGSLIWSEMTAQRGDQIVDTLHQHHGGRFPYFIEKPARDHLGQTYVSQYRSMLLETQTRAEKQIQKLEEKPFSPLNYLNLKTQYLNHPAISPDGRYMAVISVDETEKREIKLLARKAQESFLDSPILEKIESQKEQENLPKPQDGPPSGGIQRVSWFHKTNRLVYDKVDAINPIERYADLHIYDLKTQKSEQLSTGLRGREPSVSPDDQEIIFVKLEGGKTSLAAFDLNSKSHKILWTAPMQSRISYPTYLEKNKILFSLRHPSAEEHLWIYDKETQQVQKILENYKTARFALLTPHGLFFTSSQNGVHNLYLADKNFKTARPVSHVVTAVFAATWDPVLDDIYLTSMTDQGPQVARLMATDWKKTTGPLPTISGLYEDRYPPKENPEIKQEKKNVIQSQEDYFSGSNLLPSYWIPYIYTSSTDGSVGLQASTSGFDPLKKHNYSVTGFYETGLKRASGLGSYQNNQLRWPLLFHASETNSYYYKFENLLTTKNYSASIWPDIWNLSRYALLEVGAKNSESSYDPLKVYRQGAYARLLYSNLSRAGVQISPESGQSAYLGATKFYYSSDNLAHNVFVFGGNYYHSKWLPSRHVVMFRANGFILDNDSVPSVFGASTGAYMPAQDSPLPTYVMRGYSTGQFFGRRLFNLNTEYRFPMRRIDRGWGTDPYFLHQMHGAVVIDGVSVDGFAYNIKNQMFDRIRSDRSFWSGGFETRLETSLGYVLPINLILGYYVTNSADYGQKTAVGLSLQAAGF